MLIVKTYLDQSDGKGIGLFSVDLLPAGSVWWIRNEFFDKIITQDNLKSYSELSVQFIKEYGFLEASGNWHLCIDNARFSNHSDSPNSKNILNEKGEIISCITIRDVQPGEEILCDYKETCLTCINSLGFVDKEKTL